MLLINWYAVNSDRQPHQILTPRLVVGPCRQGLSDTEASLGPPLDTMLLQLLIHVFPLTTVSTMTRPFVPNHCHAGTVSDR